MLSYLYFDLNMKSQLFSSYFNNCWIFSSDLRKLLQTNLIITHPLAEEYFRAHIPTDDRTTGIKTRIVRFPKYLLDSNFIEIFSKIHETFLYRLLECRDRQIDGRTLRNEFHNFLRHYKWTAHLPKTCEISGLLQEMKPISNYCNSGQHSYTRGLLADTKSKLQVSRCSSVILNLPAALSGYTSNCLVTLLIVWLHFLLSGYTSHCLVTLLNVWLHFLLPGYTSYCLVTLLNVWLHFLFSGYTSYCLVTLLIASVHLPSLQNLLQIQECNILWYIQWAYKNPDI